MRDLLGWLVVAAMPTALAVGLVGTLVGRRRPDPVAVCRCEDCAVIAEEFAAIARRLRRLDHDCDRIANADLYLVPEVRRG